MSNWQEGRFLSAQYPESPPSLGVSVRKHLHHVNWGMKTHPMHWDPRLNEKEKVSWAPISIFLHPGCGCHVTSSRCHGFSPWWLAWLRSISQHEPIRPYLLRLGTTVTPMREIASTAIHQHKSISNVKPHLYLVKWQYSSHYSIQYNLARNIFCDSQAYMVKGKG